MMRPHSRLFLRLLISIDDSFHSTIRKLWVYSSPVESQERERVRGWRQTVRSVKRERERNDISGGRVRKSSLAIGNNSQIEKQKSFLSQSLGSKVTVFRALVFRFYFYPFSSVLFTRWFADDDVPSTPWSHDRLQLWSAKRTVLGRRRRRRRRRGRKGEREVVANG